MAESTIAEPFKYVNPVLLEDVSRALTSTARRLLDYERYLVGLGELKRRDKFLPPAVEQHVGRSIQGNLVDAETAGRLLIELTTELEDVGGFEALFSSIDERIEFGSVPAFLDEHASILEPWLEQHGMPSDTWQWATQFVDWDDLGARIEAGEIIVARGDRTIGMISATRSAEVDPASFVARAYGLRPAITREDDGNGRIHVSAAELVERAAGDLITLYRWRARRTALDGVQVVLGNPIPVFVIVIIVIAAVAFAVGAAISSLCAIGKIKDDTTCAVGLFLLIVGFIALVGFVGAVAGPTDGDSEETTPESPPDPEG